jgi:hypothetical protein
MDLTDDVFLIAHSEILRGLLSLRNGADEYPCQSE